MDCQPIDIVRLEALVFCNLQESLHGVTHNVVEHGRVFSLADGPGSPLDPPSD